MINVHILCGIPASGKSTWAKAQIAKATTSAIIISRDKTRFSILKDEDDYFDKEKEVFSEFISEIKQAIKNQVENIYIDATNINRRSREKLLNAIGPMSMPYINIIFEVFNIPCRVALQRNALRTGREQVPREAIDSMFRSFVSPDFIEGQDCLNKYHYWDYQINQYYGA